MSREGKQERLQKVLARVGVGSRRSSEELIRLGRVTVNGQVVTELGSRVGPGDVVAVDGRPIGGAEEKGYLALHKPYGFVTTLSDPQGRPTVLDLVPQNRRLYPVGRLDYDSEGLLLLTNDGDLAYKLTHPRFNVEKEYKVLVDEAVEPRQLLTLREGIELDGRFTAPAVVEFVKSGEGAENWLRFVIHEGRKRQVRRMCQAVGLRVVRLIRTRVGPVHLGNLPEGQSRLLSPIEVRRLHGAVQQDEEDSAT